jgi:hypothetical protein
MTSHALGALELARLTGRLVDETWICAEALRDGRRVALWTAPDLTPASLIDVAPAELPADRAIRVESRGGTLLVNATWPLALDVHWLREITTGFPLGLRPVRIDAGAPVKASLRLSGEFRSVVWRETGGRSRLNIYHQPAGCEVQAECAIAAGGFGPLLRALTGTTSVEWLRGVFADSCSLRWRDLAGRIGARTEHLDDLALYFRGLTTSEEHALWEAATSKQSLASGGLRGTSASGTRAPRPDVPRRCRRALVIGPVRLLARRAAGSRNGRTSGSGGLAAELAAEARGSGAIAGPPAAGSRRGMARAGPVVPRPPD